MASPRYALLLICLLAGCRPASTGLPQDAAAAQAARASTPVDEPGTDVANVDLDADTDTDTDMDADIDIDPDSDIDADVDIDPDADMDDDTDVATSTAQTVEDRQPHCAEEPLATYLFTLVDAHADPVDGCGRFDPQVAAAFDALLSEAPQPAGASLRQRLLSGPAAEGERVAIGARTAWFYTACQAHQCGTTRLALLYVPATSTMTGKLLLDRQTHWLGAEDEALRATLDARARMQPAHDMDGTGS